MLFFRQFNYFHNLEYKVQVMTYSKPFICPMPNRYLIFVGPVVDPKFSDVGLGTDIIGSNV